MHPESQLLDWMALSFVPGLGSRTIRRLLDCFHTPSAVFAACRSKEVSVNGVRRKLPGSLADPAPFRRQAEKVLEALSRIDAFALCPDDAAYPSYLKETADMPPVVYGHGRVELLATPSVALVGSRRATAYGKRIAFSLARDLAENGVTVVSGLAMGIDGEAHRGALSAGGNTIGVLGCGIDVIYPRSNRKIFEQIRQAGLLLSEYPPGTGPDTFRFPARNRIIAGLSLGVVVIEAARKSGSLITAQMALDGGREVFAVPGQIDSLTSAGTHWLIRQGAGLVQSAEDILLETGLLVHRSALSSKAVSPGAGLDFESQKLLNEIEVYPLARNELIARSGLDPAKVAELLLLLELDGFIEMLPGDELRKIEQP